MVCITHDDLCDHAFWLQVALVNGIDDGLEVAIDISYNLEWSAGVQRAFGGHQFTGHI